MISQEENGDPKPGFGETGDTKSSHDKKSEAKKKERQRAIEDTSSNNYGNIGVEGGVEDLYEKDRSEGDFDDEDDKQE